MNNENSNFEIVTKKFDVSKTQPTIERKESVLMALGEEINRFHNELRKDGLINDFNKLYTSLIIHGLLTPRGTQYGPLIGARNVIIVDHDFDEEKNSRMNKYNVEIRDNQKKRAKEESAKRRRKMHTKKKKKK